MNHIQIKGKIYNLDQPQIMGILNLSPDSFYDGGKHQKESEILESVGKMLDAGCLMIDIGALSTRPNAELISTDEEKKRLGNWIEKLKKHFPEALISVDSFRKDIIKFAIDSGVDLINDISGGRWDSSVFSIINQYQIGYCVMHSRGNFEELHHDNDYKNVADDVRNELKLQIENFTEKNNLLIDPGFGFSKNISQNFELLNEMEKLQSLNIPILCGISRKSMIWKTLKSSPNEALNGTTALHMICLEKGAKILRVHDVKEAKECINLYLKLKNYG